MIHDLFIVFDLSGAIMWRRHDPIQSACPDSLVVLRARCIPNPVPWARSLRNLDQVPIPYPRSQGSFFRTPSQLRARSEHLSTVSL